MADDVDQRKIIKVAICEIAGEVTIEDIQSKIDQTKEAYDYDWIKFYIDNGGFLSSFSTTVTLYAKHYQTPEQVEKDKRFELFKELKEEFEPVTKKEGE